ncbi:MAG: hypothetical protein DRR19_22065, partial [Candidatus Parabeggiatoa sp. nov. 1]
MKLYTDDNVVNSIEVSTASVAGSVDRRKFMLYSASCMGMMLLPGQSPAAMPFWAPLLISSFINFAFRKLAPGIGFRVEPSTGVSMDPSMLMRRNFEESAYLIANDLVRHTRLPIDARGVRYVLDASKRLRNSWRNPALPPVWDQEGYAVSSGGVPYKNNLSLTIRNKSSYPIERKIQLILLNDYKEKEYRRQYIVRADGGESARFDLSNKFRNLPAIGMKEMAYKVLGGYRDLGIYASNPDVLVSNLI